MAICDESPAMAHWPKMPRMVNEAGQRLQSRYGDIEVPGEEMRCLAEELGGYRAGSVILSDYCYNVVNRARFSFQHRVLVRSARGRYLYVGPNYAYTGPVHWKPKGGQERLVGSWSTGVCTLTDDPRK